MLSVSILSLEDKNRIKELANQNIDYLHLDIMDGKYVDNRTMEFNELANYLKDINKPFDVHLMVRDVYKYAEMYSKLKPVIITFHLDSDSNPNQVINYLKKQNIKVGIAIKPNEDVSIIKPYLDQIDLALIMSVEPGKGGQKFIKDVVPKIAALRNLKSDLIIEIDGGINNETIKNCQDCDIIVVGSYITSGDFKNKIANLK